MNATDNQKPTWDRLLTHIHIASIAGTDGYGLIEDGAIAIAGGRIAWIGPTSTLPESTAPLAPDVIDCNYIWATPGLIDCHTHLVYAGNRAYEWAQRLSGVSYAEIAKNGGGILSTVRATREASEEELVAMAAPRLASLLVEGVTTVEIKSGYGLDTENEMKMLRAAKQLETLFPVNIYTTFLGAHAMPEHFEGDKDDYIDLVCNEMIPAIAKAGLADAVDGFCETIAFSPAQIERVYQAAERHGLLVKLHAEQLSDQNGASLAARHRALSADHLEYVSEEGVKAMASAGTVAVLLPGAFYGMGETRKPPVDLFRQYRVPMAISTDCNPGTSPCASLLLMLNMACRLFGLSPVESLRGVTLNAARALGVADHLGSLEQGKIADIALWDITDPTELSYYMGFNPCIATIKNGVLHRTKN